MAGFARLVVAAETALGFKAGEFMAAYQENLTEGVMAAIDASPVAQALIEFMHGRQEWTGTAKQLLDAITPGSIDPGSPPRGWPVSGRGMSAVLTRFASALRRIGIYFERMERHGHERLRRLCLVCKVPAQPSAPSASVKTRQDAIFTRTVQNDADDPTVRRQEQPSAPPQEDGQRSQPVSSNADDADDADAPANALHDRGTDLPEGQVEVEV